VRAVLFVLVVLVMSAVGAWIVAVSTCNHLLIGTRSFDFVCGHNAPLQLVPSFFLFLIVFSLLAQRIKSRRISSGSNGSEIQE
jgi:hypothetical protein